jgi:predicted nucleotidyltransferase
MARPQKLGRRIREALPHLAPGRAADLTDAVNHLVEAFAPDRIYVFGSQARGTPTPDSDIDILVVVSRADEPTYRLATRAYATLARLMLPLEILFMTREEFDQRAPATASLPATVLREGRLLYAA